MNQKVIVVASTNKGKIKEFKEMLEPEGYEVKSLADFPDMPETIEDGTTFQENAVIKAKAVTDRYGIPAISDDSGICIAAFGGEPGVMSARYLGHDTPYDQKNQMILDRLKGETNRACYYACAIAVTRPNEEPMVFYDTVDCVIADLAAGTNGFGYDPIVYYEPLKKTMAEMTNEEKNGISHRGKAVKKLEKWLNEQGI